MGDKPVILLVDDEPSLVKILSRRLVSEGFEVLTAETGDEALKTAIARRPDLVLLDVMLPGRSGLDVCREIKKHPELKDVPIALITAKTQDRDERAGMEAGADAYLRKPFASNELIDRVRFLLRNRRVR